MAECWKAKISMRSAAHTAYPYLPRRLTIEKPDQVRPRDIAYLPMKRGFLYLVAVMDSYSRVVLVSALIRNLDPGQRET